MLFETKFAAVAEQVPDLELVLVAGVMDMLPSATEYKETWLSGFPFSHQAGLFVCSCAMTWAATQILIPDPRNVQLIDRAAAYRLSNIQPIDIATTEQHLRDGGATCKGQNSRKKATG